MDKVTGVVSAGSTVAGRATTTSVVAGTANSSGVVIGGNATGVSKLTAVVTMGKKKLSGNVQTSGSGGGTLNHSLLLNRDLPNQHPIQAIAGLKALLDSLTSDISKKADDVEITDGYMYLLSNGERIAGPYGPLGGGGGGSGNNAKLTLTNNTGWMFKNIAQNAACTLTFAWSSVEDGLSTGKGTLKVTVGGASKLTTSIDQGQIALDVSSYLTSGENIVKLNVTDSYGNSRTLNFTINVLSLTVDTTFDDTAPYSGPVTYYYTPVGAVVKTMHFELDGEEIATAEVSVTGQQQEFTIPSQAHGNHVLRVYFTAEIDGEEVRSNTLYHDLICYEEGNNTPIIASPFQPVATEQFVSFVVPYIVYAPAELTPTVEYRASGKLVNSVTVDRTMQYWSLRGDVVGDLPISITCGDTVREFTVPITESSIDVEAVTNNLELYLSAYGRSNNEAHPEVWESGDVAASLSGFNWTADGWQLDEDGNTVLRVGGDARVYIPFHLFAYDFRTTGKTIEIEFASRDVLNYDAVLFTCMSGGRGMEISAQRALLKSEQSQIGTQYKEEEHVRVAFVVEKRANNRLLLVYINGILSGSVQYPDNDNFSQTEPVGISIGTNDCTTDIYCIRVYNNDLTRQQVLNNWIADTQNGVERKARYERNNIYDAYGRITIDTLKKDVPYLVLECPVLPQFKGDKKICSGYYVDPVHPERSFRFENAQIDVQGTSSQYYYVKNYKIKFKGGFILTDGSTVELYQMNESAVPTATFTYKADVASSEGANNIILAKLYNILCPTKTPPQQADPRVRQTIDGHPIVIFWDSGSGPEFIGKYNFNNDKGTEEVFGFKPGDESWEIRQNGTDRVGFHSADFSEGSGWENDFEARYPEDNKNTSNLAAFSAWVASTDTEQATGNAIPAVTYGGVEYTLDTSAYRLAKFKAEFHEHADIASTVFYYVFTELFLCIDQREKNAFPTLFALLMLWMILFYDADSSLGIDNKGNLAFEYFLEDIDYTESGDPVFNGQNSVLWVNLRKCFYAEITAEYQRLRTTNGSNGRPLLSYEVVNDMFEAHQSIWSEAIYNEDGYRKSIEPLVKLGDTLYLPMLQGKKEQQRKWWLYNRFRYLDSKYCTGSSMEKRITIRAHAQANVKLTAYVNMYGHVFFNAEMVEHRMFRGQEYEFVWTAAGAEDPVIGINDADMLTSLGDLSPLMVELINISLATHLTYLKVGDGGEGYVNDNLTSVTLGNNYLIKTLDFRNCVKLAQAINATGCTGLEECYFDGTAITGITLPNGGILRILHLPNTVSSISLLNQQKITDFSCPDFANVSSLRVENCSAAVDTAEIVRQMKSDGRVRLVGMDWTLEDTEIMDKLLGMTGFSETDANLPTAVLSGKVHIASPLAISKLLEYEKTFPYLTITADSYVTDVLMVPPEPAAVVLDKDGKMLTMANGGYVSAYSAETINAFIEAVQEQMSAINGS